jgi:hypothetical protein
MFASGSCHWRISRECAATSHSTGEAGGGLPAPVPFVVIMQSVSDENAAPGKYGFLLRVRNAS